VRDREETDKSLGTRRRAAAAATERARRARGGGGGGSSLRSEQARERLGGPGWFGPAEQGRVPTRAFSWAVHFQAFLLHNSFSVFFIFIFVFVYLFFLISYSVYSILFVLIVGNCKRTVERWFK